MSCFRNLCTFKTEQEAIASDEAPPARPCTPQHQVLSERKSTTRKAASSQRSSLKLSSSIESTSSQERTWEPATEHLPPRSNDTKNEENLGIKFSTGFGGANPSVTDGESQKLTGAGILAFHSAPSSLASHGHKESEAVYSSPKPKPAHLMDWEGAAPGDRVAEVSGRGRMSVLEVKVTPAAAGSDRRGVGFHENGIFSVKNSASDAESSTGWVAANASVAREGTSSAGDHVCGDAGASS